MRHVWLNRDNSRARSHDTVGRPPLVLASGIPTTSKEGASDQTRIRGPSRRSFRTEQEGRGWGGRRFPGYGRGCAQAGERSDVLWLRQVQRLGPLRSRGAQSRDGRAHSDRRLERTALHGGGGAEEGGQLAGAPGNRCRSPISTVSTPDAAVACWMP